MMLRWHCEHWEVEGREGESRGRERGDETAERGNRQGIEGETQEKNIRKLFTLVNQIVSFKQVKGFIPFGESTFEFCQHLSTTNLKKVLFFLAHEGDLDFSRWRGTDAVA